MLKESVKSVSNRFYEKIQGSFKNLSMKFCFAILLLHKSHCSYPSRRRACLKEPRMIVKHLFLIFFIDLSILGGEGMVIEVSDNVQNFVMLFNGSSFS